MLIVSFLVLAIGFLVGVPLLPMLITATILQCGVVYFLTKNQNVIGMAIGLVLLVASENMLNFIVESGWAEPFPLMGWLNTGSYIVVGISMGVATLIGIIDLRQGKAG